MSDGLENRRPLSSRDTKWAVEAARWLTARGVSPNQLSISAMGFAAFGGLMFALSGGLGPWAAALCLMLGALACQGRLVCNLLDGMVAVEGGKGAKDGPFWNEAPDRVSDVLFFVGAGIGACAPALGWAAAAVAVATAYMRELGRAEGFAPDFSGPMAKQHRMAVLTGGAMLAIIWPVMLSAALWLIAVGAGATVVVRAIRLVRGLKRR